MIQPCRSGKDTDVSRGSSYCIGLEDGQHPLFVMFFRIRTLVWFRVMREFEVRILLLSGQGLEVAL